jgi:hypothetical protein
MSPDELEATQGKSFGQDWLNFRDLRDSEGTLYLLVTDYPGRIDLHMTHTGQYLWYDNVYDVMWYPGTYWFFTSYGLLWNWQTGERITRDGWHWDGYGNLLSTNNNWYSALNPNWGLTTR